jgi:NodT family efflux transporter outer membrane factor (OMF) lipoprotein
MALCIFSDGIHMPCIPKGAKRLLKLSPLLLLAGCMVGPDYERPTTKASPQWQDTGDPRIKAEPAQYRNWWKAFSDPILDRLINRAYQENLPLKVAGVRVLEARARLGSSIGGLYPQTQQMQGNLLYNRTSQNSLQGAFSKIFEYTQIQDGLAASWELDFWGRLRRAVESSDFNRLASIADYDNVLVSLTADVASRYVAIRATEKRLDIARRNAEIQQQSLQLAEIRYRGGTTSERDVEQARTQLASTRATIPTLESQHRQLTNALSVLLAMPPSQLEEITSGQGAIPVAPPYVAVGIPADLLRRRPDVRQAELLAAAQSAQIGITKADLYPAISLTGQFGVISTNAGKASLTDLFDWHSRFGSVGPTLRWNFLNYGQITNQVRVQDARLQELLLQYQQTVLTAQREVEDNLVAFLKSGDRAGFLAQSTEAAQQSLNLAVLQYREGITDFTTVLTAQQALLKQQDDLAITLGEIAGNLVGVYRALGGGWELREGKDLLPPGVKADMGKRTDWGELLNPTVYPLTPEKQPLVQPPQW